MENIRTDLAIEAHEMCSKKKAEETEVRGVVLTEENRDGLFVTVIDICGDYKRNILNTVYNISYYEIVIDIIVLS